jgi:uncharacterized protein YecA (UPF0149 family)
MDCFITADAWLIKEKVKQLTGEEVDSPFELFQEVKKYLRPLPPEPFKMGQTDSKVIDIRRRTKVGRNDPCPCGSVKKYKKCCGGEPMVVTRATNDNSERTD